MAWQLIYWSLKPSIKPFSCADWPASLQKRPEINLRPGSSFLFDWVFSLPGRKKAFLSLWCKLKPHSSSTNTLLSPPSLLPPSDLFHLLLFLSYCLFSPVHFCSSFPNFDIDLVKLIWFEWRLSNWRRLNTVFYVSTLPWFPWVSLLAKRSIMTASARG